MAVETRYAHSGDVNIAYQVSGDGPFDLVYAPGFVTHIEMQWTLPSFAPFLETLGSFCRLIRFDKRGTGMSDSVGGAPTLETRMDDLRAVMDAAGSRRAAVFGISEGAAMSLLFAATYPERIAALVLRSAFPRTMWAHDYPWGLTEDAFRMEVEQRLLIYGPTAEALRSVGRLGAFTDEEADGFLRMLRYGASPGGLETLLKMNRDIDIRSILSAVRVPTMILHGADDTRVPVEVADYMAARIPGASVSVMPGIGHLALGGPSADVIGARIQEFLTDLWTSGGWDDVGDDRTLITVLFTDIVDSTAKAIELGDREWTRLLERHHAMVRRQLLLHRGQEVDTAGDGFLASFDGPARAIRCAEAVITAASELGLQLRAGIHTGECERAGGKITGIAVHTGARIASQAAPGEVMVSSTVRDLVAGSEIRFADRGTHALKGLPDQVHLLSVSLA